MPKTAQLLFLAAAIFSISGCDRYRQVEKAGSQAPVATQSSDVEHPHRGAAAGGIIATLGRDEHHAEAIVQQDNRLTIYILAEDETRIQEVDQQELTGYVKLASSHATSMNDADSGEAAVILFQADPLPGDSPGMTSRFAGELPERFAQQTMYLTLPGLRIQGERFVARFEIPSTMPVAMPLAVDDDEARKLYLTAGGHYTDSDIAANGAVTAAEKYRDFRAQHDANPQPGERICPISKTKANSQCSWIIGGERYEFCCPPCIDEFLEVAKSNPQQVQPADSYRKKNG